MALPDGEALRKRGEEKKVKGGKFLPDPKPPKKAKKSKGGARYGKGS